MDVSGALFDVDGVLVDSPHERAWREALRVLMEGAWRDVAGGSSYAPERFTSEVYQGVVAGRPRLEGARAVLAFFGVADVGGERAAVYGAAKQALVAGLIARGEFRAFDDALRLVVALRGAGVRLATASSSRNARGVLEGVRLGAWAAGRGLGVPGLAAGASLWDVFDVHVDGWEVMRGKPDPEVFLLAAGRLGVTPGRCVVFEDAGSGVLAARAGGFACVGVARLGDRGVLEEAGADWVVGCLDEVAGLPLRW